MNNHGYPPYPPNDNGLPLHQGHTNHQTSNGTKGRSRMRNVVSYSFSSSSLLEVSLMYEPQTNELKRPFFCFLKLLPGGKNQKTGERTYIPDKNITLKIALDRILEFAKALRVHAAGQHVNFGPYTMYTDTSKAAFTSENSKVGNKQLLLSYIPGNRDQSGAYVRGGEPKVMLTLSLKAEGKDPEKVSFPMTPYMASAVADVCEKIANKGCDLEIDRQVACAKRKSKPLQQ